MIDFRKLMTDDELRERIVADLKEARVRAGRKQKIGWFGNIIWDVMIRSFEKDKTK